MTPASPGATSGSAAPATEDPAPHLERLFDRVPEEVSVRLDPQTIEGEIPAWLRGTYYANGPARFARGDHAYRHWLDGDGLVLALRFDGDGVHHTARFVDSHKRRREEAEGRALFRAFGTGFEGDELLRGIALASPVNVSVYPFAGRLLAFGEQGLPWELDPTTLETRGEHTFDRRLNPVAPFSAHPGFDATSGEMVNFGVSFSAVRPMLNLYRFAADGTLRDRRRSPLPYPASMHDFGLSPRFAVFYLNPYLLDMGPLMEDGATVLDCLEWRPELGSALLVIDRESAEEVARVPVGRGPDGERAGYCLHHVNAFEPDGDTLVVDVLELEEPVYPDYRPIPDLFQAVAPTHPVRYVVDLDAGALAERREVPYAEKADFPALPPGTPGRPTDRFWMLSIAATGRDGRKFLDRLVAIDLAEGAEVDAWRAPPGHYLGNEPVVVTGAGADGAEERRILVHELDAERRRSAMVLFDADDLARGPVTRLPLPAPLPPLFHACFAPA